MRLLCALVCVFILAAAATGQIYTITTLAGTGTAGYSGDGGPAASARLNGPSALALDASGNLYIADTQNQRIRRVGPLGNIGTVAGIGTAGYSGDGGPATSAQLGNPAGVTLDSSGNLYIGDIGNNRVRRVGPLGNIGTVAGTGTGGYSGDGGPATSAQLNWPTGVAVDSSGNLYIADFSNNRVRRVGPLGNIGTVAGPGVAGNPGDGGPATSAWLQSPVSVAVDSSGNLYIAEVNGHRIRKVTPDGTISTVAGTGTKGYSGDGGPAMGAQLDSPAGLAVDAAGRVYFADAGNHRIRVLTPESVGLCSYAVSTSDLGVAAAGGRVKLTIHTDLGCSWNLSGLPGWLTLSGSASGASSAEITLVAASNPSGPRVAALSIGGVSVPVRQPDSWTCGGSASCVIRALPHMLFGNEWTTALLAANSAAQERPFALAFYGYDGGSQPLPFGGGAWNLSSLTGVVPPRGMNYYEAGNPAVQTAGAWALVIGDASVTVHGLFGRASAEGNFSEAGVPGSGGYSNFLIPFDAAPLASANAPFHTGFAVSNLHPSESAHITCVARDQGGTVIANAVSVPTLNPMGHWDGYMFPALVGKRGTLECSADTLVSAIALRVIGTSAFSSLPVIVK